MAASALLLVGQAGQIGSLILDCVLSESHKSEVEVTSHNVEEGADITDHARPKPREVTLTGIVSETPINIVQQRRIVESKGQRFETVTSTASPRGSTQYVEAALAKLENLYAKPQLVDLITSIRKYSNMMLTSLSIPRDPKTGDALNFTAVFREVRFATLRLVEAQTKVVKTANKKVKLGKQVGPPAPEDKRDTLDRINDGLNGGLFDFFSPPSAP